MGGLPFCFLYQCAAIEGIFTKETIDINSTDFSTELSLKILRGIFASPLGDLLSDYRIKKKRLRYIYSSLNLDQSHFVVVIVDVSERKVFMINPLQQKVDHNHVLAGKWIAKIFSIMDYYINQNNDNLRKQGIYLGNKDMITDEMVEQIDRADMENKY